MTDVGKRKLKVLFGLPRFHTNAVPWVRILGGAGHHVSVHVVTCGNVESYDLIQPRVIEPCSLSQWIMRHWPGKRANMGRSFPAVGAYGRVLQEEDPDLVVLRDPLRPFSIVAATCALWQGRKVAFYDQEDVHPGRTTRTFWRRALLRSFGLPTITPRVPVRPRRRSIGSAISIPFGPYHTDVTPECSPLARPLAWPPRILMVAKYRPRKGHRILLHALGRLAHVQQFSVTFCGEQTTEEDARFCRVLLEIAEEVGIADRVAFANNIPHTKMGELYRKHDLFVLPSQNEPCAIAPIEAALSGCAVLVSRDSGTRAYFPDQEIFDCDPNDVEELSEKIGHLLKNVTTLTVARDRACSHAVRVTSSSAILGKFEELAGIVSR